MKWFQSYLSGQTQKVRIGLSQSKVLPVTHGVLQGAILSPVLFCIYTNNLPSLTQVCIFNSFVDDSKLFSSFPIKDVTDAWRNLEDDLRHGPAWCCKNELLTKFFFSRHTSFIVCSPQDMTLTLLDKSIKPVPYAEDLGVTFG